MSAISQARQLVRVRGIERRFAVLTLADGIAAVAVFDARLARLKHLSNVLAVDRGPQAGSVVAASGQTVANLLAGVLATETQRERSVILLGPLEQSLAVADARSRNAEDRRDRAERIAGREAEARKTFTAMVRGMGRW
ncbi:hypothetical protein [Sphingomonas sp.]|uniref:hypothetical protein n=1 Tax=Sphingomonas sp. TaxID=28214 RepID=UPI0025E9B0BA|nr:hypothetical protein [Sphingomonas sp.]